MVAIAVSQPNHLNFRTVPAAAEPGPGEAEMITRTFAAADARDAFRLTETEPQRTVEVRPGFAG